MSYIGNKPADSYLTLEKQTFTTSATDTYTLDREVSGVNDIELFLNNVRQEPTEAYTISGTTLTLASAITSSDSMYCIYQGRSVGTQAPATGSVTNAMLAGSIANNKLAGGIESSKLAFASYPYRNLIINGDMSIAQRGTSQSGVNVSAYGQWCDRWHYNGSSGGTWTISQDTDVPTGQGFVSSLKIDCTTANASLSASNFAMVRTLLEAQNLQHLKYGTSSAESLTLSFWVKSNKTGTYIVWFYADDGARTISKSYTINSADTWEKKTITIDGDSSGTINNDNGVGLRVNFFLVAGSNYTTGTLNTSWGTVVISDRAVGQVNLADSTSNYINITGVQLEVGTSASDFEFLPYDVNKRRCERYYLELRSNGQQDFICHTWTGSQGFCPIHFREEMRDTPTFSGGLGGSYLQSTSGKTVSSYSVQTSSKTDFCLNVNGSGFTTDASAIIRASGTDSATFDAEL